jgi:hypothetical protein
MMDRIEFSACIICAYILFNISEDGAKGTEIMHHA